MVNILELARLDVLVNLLGLILSTGHDKNASTRNMQEMMQCDSRDCEGLSYLPTDCEKTDFATVSPVWVSPREPRVNYFCDPVETFEFVSLTVTDVSFQEGEDFLAVVFVERAAVCNELLIRFRHALVRACLAAIRCLRSGDSPCTSIRNRRRKWLDKLCGEGVHSIETGIFDTRRVRQTGLRAIACAGVRNDDGFLVLVLELELSSVLVLA